MRFLFDLLYTYVLHIYGYNIFARIPFFGRKSVSPLARHLGRFDFLMTTSSLVDQIGWEGRVMLTHFGMETNGRQTSDTRKHIEDTKIL